MKASRESLAHIRRGGYPRTMIIVGVILGLSTGFLDVTISFFSFQVRFSMVSFAPAIFAVTACAVFLLYAILYFVVLSPLNRIMRLDELSLAISLALFFGAFLVLNDISRYFSYPNRSFHLLNLLGQLSVSSLIAVCSYFSSVAIAQIPKRRDLAATLGAAVPFLLFETMVFVWLHAYRLGGFLVFSGKAMLVNVGYVFTILLTLGLFYLVGRMSAFVKWLAVLAVLVLLSPLVTYIDSRPFGQQGSAGKGAAHRVRHVILIIVDTLRPDFLSCYNPESAPTPFIDQLALDGVLFMKAVSSSPWTLPSVSSMMTGLPPAVHRAVHRESKLPASLQTLAEYMLEEGYVTAAIGKNPFLVPERNVAQGFLDYNFFPKKVGNSIGAMLLRKILPRRALADPSSTDLTEIAVAWIEENRQKDFFLWIHYLDPHQPYEPPAGFLPKAEPPPKMSTSFETPIKGEFLNSFVPGPAEQEWIKALYRGEVRYVDENIGELIGALIRLELYEESLIFFVSDHGEEFWEHGGYEHGHSLYDELLWVPLIVKLPFSSLKAKVEGLVSVSSLAPTILDLCGITYESGLLSAPPLSPLLGVGAGAYEGYPIVSTGLLRRGEMESVVFKGSKYIRSLISGREELFDLARDPGELESLASLLPGKVEQARSILNEHNERAFEIRQRYGIKDDEKVEIDEETMKRLRSLGYVK